ncbi:MAG: glycoside hydrolase family 92 protein, partial [Clostridia bacterium]|nr:glycoside hydrolase family 92 protein [Clostridia bacterium]
MNKAKYVDTSIGTVAEEDSIDCHGGGKTYPGASVSGGMVQLSPDTVTGGDNGNGYNYCHNTIEGFSFNHMSGIGWYGDLGNLQIMPVTGETDLRSGSNEHVEFKKGTLGWKSGFSHDSEVTEAGYYAVKLDRYNILAEATANIHTGMLRFTYPEKENAKIIMNFSRRIGGKADFQKIKIVNENTIEGKIICTPKGGGFGHGHGKIFYDFYFTCELSQTPLKMQFFSNEEMQSANLNEFSH